MTTNDLDLVREYALHKSESAFAALVSRHSKRIRWPSAFVLAGDTIAEDFPPDDADKDDFNHNCVGGVPTMAFRRRVGRCMAEARTYCSKTAM